MIPLPPRRPRGFTLVELMISAAIAAILLAALFGVVQSQQSAFFKGHLQRAAQGSARAALAFVEQRLAVAGYGLDAPLAFDFQYYGFADPMPCPALANGCPRDAVGGNDELVFYARNPRYWVPDDRTGAFQPSGNAWRVLAVDGSSVTLSARVGDVFEKGRILQLVCRGGATWAYVTLAQNVPEQTAPSSLRITLAPASDTNPFRRQTMAAGQGCFTGGAARAFLIDRFRFHVRPVQGPRGVVPYLVLDAGLDRNGNGPDEADEVVIAEGIESFQVGYVMTNGALAPRGTTPGTAIVFAQGAGPTTGSTAGTGMTTLRYSAAAAAPGQGEYEPTSWYRFAVGPTPTIAQERLTDHQANIRAVRIAIVARGAEPDPALGGRDFVLPVLNQDAFPAWLQGDVAFSRARVETSVPVRNMVARGMNDF